MAIPFASAAQEWEYPEPVGAQEAPSGAQEAPSGDAEVSVDEKEELVTEEVVHRVREEECPCFDRGDGLQFLNLRTAFSTVDIHKPTSCIARNGRISLAYVNVHGARDGRPAFNGSINGVVYKHLSATFIDTPERQDFECSQEDMHRMISEGEAKACFELIEEACAETYEKTCPCYGIHNLVDAETKAKDGSLKLDKEKTCVNDAATYGIFQFSDTNLNGLPCEDNSNECSTTLYGITKSNVPDTPNFCMSGSDELQIVNQEQTMHCQELLKDSCAILEEEPVDAEDPDNDAEEPDVDVGPIEDANEKCKDEGTFVEEGSIERSCDWVIEDPAVRCHAVDSVSKKPNFHYCRKTCGYCACADVDEGNQCCEDKSGKFEFKSGKMRSCRKVVGRKRRNKKLGKRARKRCKSQNVASNCPEACGYCNFD